VSVDEEDNDPKVLLSYVARALGAVQPVGSQVLEALASPVSSVPGSVVPRLGAAFWSMTVPVVLVLDDVHLLRNRECRDSLSVLVGQAWALRAQLSADLASSIPGPSSLTSAELRVLPMLTTHLTFPEIGAELFLSPHTVKSQAISIYRKLGASSRTQAVARSRELGLLDV